MMAFPLTVALRAAGADIGTATSFLAGWSLHMAQEYNPRLRVNAIAPGFFLTDQNRFLLNDPVSGEWTDRGRRISRIAMI